MNKLNICTKVLDEIEYSLSTDEITDSVVTKVGAHPSQGPGDIYIVFTFDNEKNCRKYFRHVLDVVEPDLIGFGEESGYDFERYKVIRKENKAIVYYTLGNY